MATLLLFSSPFFWQARLQGLSASTPGLAVVLIYLSWRHLPSHSVFPRIYVIVPIGFLFLVVTIEIRSMAIGRGLDLGGALTWS